MSSAASRPPNTASTSTEETLTPASEAQSSLRKPSGRSLMKPPARPKPPTPPVAVTPPASAPPEEPAVPRRPGPISLPSEPMQYRAIGLLKGKYIASEEQFNRGDIAAEDGTLIDAVLLGRVTSLIKKHLDLEQDHLWVVYPRTLYKEVEEQASDDETDAAESDAAESAAESEDRGSENKIPALHVQIVGVWEPETLSAEKVDETDETRPLSSAEAEAQCNQFSIRGEIAKYSEEDGEILVNIVQKSKSENTKPKRPFKLLVNGKLTGRTVGYFWDLKVERQAGKLVLKEGKSIAVVPPKKKPKNKKGGGRRRPPVGSKPRSAAAAGAPKPKPKPKTAAETSPAQSLPAQTSPAQSLPAQSLPAQSSGAAEATEEKTEA